MFHLVASATVAHHIHIDFGREKKNFSNKTNQSRKIYNELFVIYKWNKAVLCLCFYLFLTISFFSFCFLFCSSSICNKHIVFGGGALSFLSFLTRTQK